MDKSYVSPISDFLVCTYATEIYRPTNEFLSDCIIPSGLEKKVTVDTAVCTDFAYVIRPGEENYKKTNEVLN
jgi:hypothetical protein